MADSGTAQLAMFDETGGVSSINHPDTRNHYQTQLVITKTFIYNHHQSPLNYPHEPLNHHYEPL